MSENVAFYISDIGRIMRKRFDVAAKGLGVTGAQWRVIMVVHRNPGVNQGQLADILEVEPITTCRMVDRLEQGGLVERRRDPQDRRAWRIFLTEAAHPLVDQLSAIGEELVALSTSVLSPEERDSLILMLAKMRTRLLDDTVFNMESIHHG
jgi:DNA-binding MarR family transcriptional regulator